ncbi:helix-turn-helix domain-containing protein [Kiloniella antarctica]|uniref:Helix-turn-helix domain-containing protein n=1 Tax=Kiloniella antarctica TaxID=1550907 RepID=A0ABW5BN50_9PROT
MQKTRDNASGGDTPDFDQPKVTVAEILRTGREKRGQDLRAVANVLRIRYVFLEAIERGDFTSLPGDTYAYGFVRTYAGYLNLDKDEIVRQFKGEVESYGARKTLIFPTPVPESKTPGLAILLISVLLLAIAYGGWSAISRFDVELPDWVPFTSHGKVVVEDTSTDGAVSGTVTASQDEESVTQEVPVEAQESSTVGAIVAPSSEATAAAPVTPEIIEPEAIENTTTSEVVTTDPDLSISPNEVLDSLGGEDEIDSSEEVGVGAEANEVGISDEATNETANAVVTPPPPPEPEVFGDEGVASAISILAEQDAWMHIVDATGEVVFSRVLRAGSVYNVPKRDGLVMTTGNAGGIILKLNGKELPKLGPVTGVRRDIILSEEGLLESIQSE